VLSDRNLISAAPCSAPSSMYQTTEAQIALRQFHYFTVSLLSYKISFTFEIGVVEKINNEERYVNTLKVIII
jgi:hypothetical protein